MPKILIEEPHALSAEEAKARVEGLGQILADRFSFALSWCSETEAKIERTGAAGSIQIEPGRFLVSLDLSFALAPLKGKIEGWISEGLRKVDPAAASWQEAQPCGCAYNGSRRVTQCEAHAALDARLAPPPALHERGGPLPTLRPGYHPRLAQVIQEARGRLHAGVEPMDIGAYLAEMAYCLPPAVPSLLAGPGFSQEDLQVAVAYLLKAMESKARIDVIRDRKAAGLGWLALDLINDHNGQRETHLVGIVTSPDAVPHVVGCYQPGQKGPACLNEIARAPAMAGAYQMGEVLCFTSETTVPRLTRTSVLTLNSDQLGELHETGRVRHGGAWIRLVPQSEVK